jgi:hypothetical protein
MCPRETGRNYLKSVQRRGDSGAWGLCSGEMLVSGWKPSPQAETEKGEGRCWCGRRMTTRDEEYALAKSSMLRPAFSASGSTVISASTSSRRGRA